MAPLIKLVMDILYPKLPPQQIQHLQTSFATDDIEWFTELCEMHPNAKTEAFLTPCNVLIFRIYYHD